MRRKTARMLYYAMAAACLVFASCGQKTEVGRTADPAPSSAAAASDSNRIKIKTPDENAVVEFHLRGEEPKIEYSSGGQAKVLRAHPKDSGKRKYELEGGGVIAEIKSDADSFKLRMPDGRLLWKVKLSEDKIKISDNEEGNNPFVLEVKGQDRIKVMKNEQEIGQVNFYADRSKIKVKTASDQEVFESNTNRFSAMYGVLLMEGIAEPERFIIMSELLARGR
ncbi:MAG TPA: hypothetical protein VLD57_03705 [Blastocatellia bacterium]|nr:hypothetical protein [Blastocatellia bacterium]